MYANQGVFCVKLYEFNSKTSVWYIKLIYVCDTKYVLKQFLTGRNHFVKILSGFLAY